MLNEINRGNNVEINISIMRINYKKRIKKLYHKTLTKE